MPFLILNENRHGRSSPASRPHPEPHEVLREDAAAGVSHSRMCKTRGAHVQHCQQKKVPKFFLWQRCLHAATVCLATTRSFLDVASELLHAVVSDIQRQHGPLRIRDNQHDVLGCCGVVKAVRTSCIRNKIAISELLLPGRLWHCRNQRDYP